MQKIRTYFKVLFASLNPVKAKKYFLGFSIGQAFVFSLITITFLWLFFLYTSISIFSYKIAHSEFLKEQTSNIAVKVSKGLYNVIEKVPFNSIKMDSINKQIKVLGLYQPYLINFYIDSNCSLDNLQNPKFKISNNALFVFCSKDHDMLQKDINTLLNTKPLLSVFINTNKHAVALDSVLNRQPGYIDFILTSDYLDLGVQEQNGIDYYKTQKIYFKDIFTKDKYPAGIVLVYKRDLLGLLNRSIENIPSFVNAVYSKYVPQVVGVMLKLFVPILIPIFILISFVPIKTFVIFFNFTGSILLGAVLGLLLSQLKAFNKTAKDFKSNLLLGTLTTTSLFLYRFLVSLLLGATLLVNDNKFVYFVLRLVLFNTWLYLLGVIFIMVLLKKDAQQQLQQAQN